MPKKKILWVVYDFVQAGGQRYVYEITKALNKEKYQIDFLKTTEINQDKNWDNEFYYQPTLDLGCKVILLADILKQQKPSGGRLNKLINRKQKSKELKRNILSGFFAQYDHVNFSGISVYGICIHNHLKPENAFIHVLTFGFQHENMYDDYDKSFPYKFISPITPGAIKRDLKEFKNYSYTYFPLCLETTPYHVKKNTSQHKVKIAIFTRLSPMKPLDPFFYGLKLLLEQGSDVELNIYGAGDPVALGIMKQLDYLYLTERVKFMGHSDSMPQTLQDNPPDLIWFQSANKEPGGYAAFEISMSGLPQLFWDFMDTEEKRLIGEIFPSFTNMTSFVEYSRKVLNDKDLQKQIGEKQREYVLANYSIEKHIHIVEELFDK